MCSMLCEMDFVYDAAVFSEVCFCHLFDSFEEFHEVDAGGFIAVALKHLAAFWIPSLLLLKVQLSIETSHGWNHRRLRLQSSYCVYCTLSAFQYSAREL